MLPPKCNDCDEIATHRAVYDGDVTYHTALLCEAHADHYEDRDYSIEDIDPSVKASERQERDFAPECIEHEATIERLTRERDDLRVEVARMQVGLRTIRADYPATAQAVNVILWPMATSSS